MPGKHPFDLPKYQDTQTRVSSSISGGQHAQAAVQPRFPHDPIEKPTPKQPDLRVINGGKSSRNQGTNNPKTQAIPKSILKRLPPALLAHPFLWTIVFTVAAGSILLKEDETDVMTGKPVEDADPEESVNYLVKEIQNYDPDYTYTHENDEAGIQFLANLLHYEKLEYYNKHRNACRQDFNPNLFAKTLRDLDAREDILNTLYGQTEANSRQETSTEAMERIQKLKYEDYKDKGGKLPYNDWLMLNESKGLEGSGPDHLRFKASPKSGLNISDNIKISGTGDVKTVELELRGQRIGANGKVEQHKFSQHSFQGTFNSKNGDLNIDWYETTNTGNKIGKEIISSVIEKIGPNNIKSVSAKLGNSNRVIFDGYKNNNFDSLKAMQSTPLGKALSDIGFTRFNVDRAPSQIKVFWQ